MSGKGGGKRNRKRRQPQKPQKPQKQSGVTKGGPPQKGKNPRKKKEKVSSGDGRKRKTTRGGPTKGKIDLAQARLDLIIRSKYQNPAKPTPTPLESKICQLLVDLEASSRDLKPHLRDLGIVSARKINVTQTQKSNCNICTKITTSKMAKITR
eukprot:1049653_1